MKYCRKTLLHARIAPGAYKHNPAKYAPGFGKAPSVTKSTFAARYAASPLARPSWKYPESPDRTFRR